MSTFIAKLLGNCIVKATDKKCRKKSIIRDIIDDPDSFMLIAFVENGELSIKVKRKNIEIAQK